MILQWNFAGLLKCDAALLNQYTVTITHPTIQCQISEDLNLQQNYYDNL